MHTPADRSDTGTNATRPDAVPPARKPLLGLEVIRKETLCANMVRVFVGGNGFADYTDNGFTDQYVKLLFFPNPEDAAGFSDLKTARQELPLERRPVSRTYTVRRVDGQQRQLAIDFVVHGDEGLAGPWAAAAQPGDTLYLSGPGGKFAPSPEAQFHLFCGDESALPAIAAALDALPRQARGAAFLEVEDAHSELRLQAPANVEVTWLHRAAAGDSTALLADAVSAMPWPTSRVQAFIHGEREAVKALRDVVFHQRGLAKDRVSISGYWARGRAEDAFQAEKRMPIGQI